MTWADRHPNTTQCRQELEDQKVKSATGTAAPRAFTQNQSYTQIKSGWDHSDTELSMFASKTDFLYFLITGVNNHMHTY